jgi:hypothetical protein
VLGIRVSINGTTLCTAAVDGQIQAYVGFGGHAGEPSVSVQGYREIGPSKSERLEWKDKDLHPGDKVTIELVTTTSPDRPMRMSKFDSSASTQEMEERIAQITAMARIRTEENEQKVSRSPAERSLAYCAFCGKGERQVAKLIPGPDVFICDECVALCNQILEEK